MQNCSADTIEVDRNHIETGFVNAHESIVVYIYSYSIDITPYGKVWLFHSYTIDNSRNGIENLSCCRTFTRSPCVLQRILIFSS